MKARDDVAVNVKYENDFQEACAKYCLKQDSRRHVWNEKLSTFASFYHHRESISPQLLQGECLFSGEFWLISMSRKSCGENGASSKFAPPSVTGEHGTDLLGHLTRHLLACYLPAGLAYGAIMP